jgi:RNA polymerase-binding transcription factor DksA
MRYSDSDLAEFKALIEQKLARAKSELNYYHEQILEISETVNGEEEDWSEGAMTMSDLELLHNLSRRQSNFIQALEMALNYIENKSYGVCVVTGKLIDKSRLLAAPTTTKSLAAKHTLK